jgi:hypothetical protein
MAQERERQRVGGAALSRLGEGGREEGERGHTAWWAGSICWARWPVGRGKEKGK